MAGKYGGSVRLCILVAFPVISLWLPKPDAVDRRRREIASALDHMRDEMVRAMQLCGAAVAP